MAGRTRFFPLLFIFFSGLLFSLFSCHVARSVYWNVSDLKDYKKFPADTLPHSHTPWLFYEKNTSIRILLPDSIKNSEDSLSFDTFLEDHKTVSFLIIRNDTIIYERYFQGYSRASTLPSFSIAKSFVSSLVGIAKKEGYIQSLDQPITDFLPKLTNSGMNKVTLRNLLEMRSGLDYNEGYLNPFGEVAKFYYGLDLKKYTLQLKTAYKSDSVYQYQSANTQLLAMALENATGESLPYYFQEKVWGPIGNENDASWSYDSKKNHETKAFCCFNAKILDFAKFGRLFLNQGSWNGQEVVPAPWVKESLTVYNDSRDSDGFPYTYGWRVTLEGDFFAKGVGGQYIYVCPHHNILILRFGSKYGNVSWANLMGKLCHSFFFLEK